MIFGLMLFRPCSAVGHQHITQVLDGWRRAGTTTVLSGISPGTSTLPGMHSSPLGYLVSPRNYLPNDYFSSVRARMLQKGLEIQGDVQLG